METWIRTPSEAIRAYRYDAAGKRLGIRFTSGGEYEYMGATRGLFRQFLAAESKGTFFAAHIRDRLPFKKVRG